MGLSDMSCAVRASARWVGIAFGILTHQLEQGRQEIGINLGNRLAPTTGPTGPVPRRRRLPGQLGDLQLEGV